MSGTTLNTGEGTGAGTGTEVRLPFRHLVAETGGFQEAAVATEIEVTTAMVATMTGAISALAMKKVIALEALTMESSGTALKGEGELGDLLKWVVLST